MKSQIAFFKGEFIPYDEANLHITTHALHYGTSIFEGIRGNWNKEDETLYVFSNRKLCMTTFKSF